MASIHEIGFDHQYVHKAAPDDHERVISEKITTSTIGSAATTATATSLIKTFGVCNSSSPSGSTSSCGFAFGSETYYHSHQGQSKETRDTLINFKSGYDGFLNVHGNSSSMLTFDQNHQSSCQKDDHNSMWDHDLVQSNQWVGHPRLMEETNCFDTACNYGFMMVNHNSAKEISNHGDWLYSEATAVTDSMLESGSQDVITGCSLKRQYSGESMEVVKKQCGSSANSTAAAAKKTKPKSLVPSKDPQSIAAKNRRERISERLKILQELVPNGSKVDLVTMLEKAISYVKFLQLQVKVLATDEFWPVQGGKAPDISQVKEAIDAILSSQRDRNSSSK